jgi:glycosyltransferase involved in cell wall biosynthesis
MTQTTFHMRAGCGGSQALFLRPLAHQFRLRFPTVVLTIHGDTDAAWVFSGIRDVNVEVVQSDQAATQVQFQVPFELPAPVFNSGAVQGGPYDGMVAALNAQLVAAGVGHFSFLSPISDPWILMPELPRAPVSIKPNSVFWDVSDAALFRIACAANDHITFYFVGAVENASSNAIDCNGCELPDLAAICRACRLFVGHPHGSAYPLAFDHTRAGRRPASIVQSEPSVAASAHWRGDRVRVVSDLAGLNRYFAEDFNLQQALGGTVCKPRGVFLNPEKAQCSIHESGVMAWECLKDNPAYEMDYLELSATSQQIPWGYDFYLFNYHHFTMGWLDTALVPYLPGLTATFVLETLPNNPYPLCPKGVFDAYCALDPTMEIDDKKVYAFPRPLEASVPVNIESPPSAIPKIGTFGFPTPGKGFELVVDAVNREFDRAIVRINIPLASYAGDTSVLQGEDYTDYLEKLCRNVAKPGIEVQVTRDFLSKEALIAWCAENTLNCFLYNRDQPGLSATTDQAITSGRPLAVSDNPTFRHLHRYVIPYPYRSLKQSIEASGAEVKKMGVDWSKSRFAQKFIEVLADHRLLPAPTGNVSVQRVVQSKLITRPKILFVSHKEKQCGIHEYGKNIANALANSKIYEFIYCEVASEIEFQVLHRQHRPQAVIYNHYPTTMPWFTEVVANSINVPQLGIMHEVTQHDADFADNALFDFHICPDPTLKELNPIIFKTGRLIPRYINTTHLPKMVTIGSFGFGFPDKGFESIVEMVQQEFDYAKIRFLMPMSDLAYVGGPYPRETADRCRSLIRKPGVQLEINHDFLDMRGLLDFLAGNSVNVFLYDQKKDRGISSTIEHALAVQRPLAISRCGMFRHVIDASPSIVATESSLTQIISNGVAPLVPFLGRWNAENLIVDYEKIFDSIDLNTN